MPNSTDNASTADNQQERIPKEDESLAYYLAGFVDGEGSFNVAICHQKTARLGWKIDPHFQVYQHKDNATVLYVLHSFFQCGYVSKKGGNPSCYMYCVDNLRQLQNTIVPFFETYPIIGKKYDNFSIFREIVSDLLEKKHLTKDGFLEIAAKAYRMNGNGRFRRTTFQELQSSLE